MTDEARTIGHKLLETGTLVSFRIVEKEVLSGPDEAEFGLRLKLKFTTAEGENDLDEDDVAENTAEWGALGFMFVLGVLSFADAKPREASVLEYEQHDEFKLADFIEGLRFVRGELRFSTSRRSRTSVPIRRRRQGATEATSSTTAPSSAIRVLFDRASVRREYRTAPSAGSA